MENEKRIIDGAALLDEVERTDWYHIDELGQLSPGANSELHTPLFKAEDIFALIETAPTVDAVGVVRCKNCVSRTYDKYDDDYWCNNTRGLCGRLEDDAFCPYGRRREDE